jgi:hypothetical protein
MVVNAFDPWLSDDVEKDTRRSSEVAKQLDEATVGLTPSNLDSDWLLFEAGTISKKVQQGLVCPLLIDLKPSDVVGPLAQFQFTTLSKDNCKKLVETLNCALTANKPWSSCSAIGRR